MNIDGCVISRPSKFGDDPLRLAQGIGADQNTDEAAKRKAAEEQFASARQDSCNRAKQAKSTLESGVRIGHTNAAGEREIMDDAARAQEAKRIDAIVARDCR